METIKIILTHSLSILLILYFVINNKYSFKILD